MPIAPFLIFDACCPFPDVLFLSAITNTASIYATCVGVTVYNSLISPRSCVKLKSGNGVLLLSKEKSVNIVSIVLAKA